MFGLHRSAARRDQIGTQPLEDAAEPAGEAVELASGHRRKRELSASPVARKRLVNSAKYATGETGGCGTLTAHGPAISLAGGGSDGIWWGQVRPEVTTLELRFADGSHTSIKPTDGFILFALNRSQITAGGLTEAIARNVAGTQVGHETFKPTKP